MATQTSHMPLDEALGGAFKDADTPRILHVRVTNKNTFTLKDRFDGVPYTFEPHIAISIPADAAAHIFGWYDGVEPEVMRRFCKKRFGWNTPEMEKEGKPDKFCDALEIKPMLYRLVPMQVGGEADVAAGEEGEASDTKRKKAVAT